jgi:ferritin
MNFENSIKNWINLDNRLKLLNDEIKKLRNDKNIIQDRILNYVENNNLSKTTIEINDGKLKFNNSRTTQPLTLKFIQECLNEVISDKSDVEKIIDYIKSKREITEKMIVNRYYS